MCGYCKNKDKDAWLVRSSDEFEGVEAKITVIDGSAYLTINGWFDGNCGIQTERTRINYCPMCGRELRGDVR